MKKISQVKLASTLLSFSTLEGYLEKLQLSRQAQLYEMQGYPVGSNIVGRLQSQFKFSSMRDLLVSIKRMRDLAKIASDIILANPQLRVDREIQIESQLAAFIEKETAYTGGVTLPQEDLKIVIDMIMISEVTNETWSLEFPHNSNLYVDAHKLYNNLLNPIDVTVDNSKGKERALSLSANQANTYVSYISDQDKIMPVTEKPRLTRLLTTEFFKGDENQKKIVEEAVKTASLLNAISNLRVLDHFLSFMQQTDIWSQFIPARSAPTPAVNLERARGLHFFSAFLHQFLVYEEIFSIEFLRQNYTFIETWTVPFPPLPEYLVKQYEQVIAAHDFLNAASDVTDVLGSFTSEITLVGQAKVSFIIKEIQSYFELPEVFEKYDEAVAKNDHSVKLENLKLLDDARYNAVLFGQPIAKFNLLIEINDALTLKDLMTLQYRIACAAITPGIARYYRAETLDKLKAMKAHCPLNLKVHLPAEFDPTSVVDTKIEGGKLYVSEGHPHNSSSYQDYVRKTTIFTVFTSHHMLVNGGNKFLNPPIVHLNRAKRLEKFLGDENMWRGLLPDSLHKGTEKIIPDDLRRLSNLKKFLETVSNEHYNFIVRTISNPYRRTHWATALSGGFLLYELNMKPIKVEETGELRYEDTGKPKDFNPIIIKGEGLPYGVDYSALADKSYLKGLQISDFIPISEDITLALLPITTIPLPGEQLVVSTMQYNKEIVFLYYPGKWGEGALKPKYFVYAPAMTNMALLPNTLSSGSIPKMLADRHYVYANDSVLLNVDINYSTINKMYSPPAIDLPMVSEEWHRSKAFLFLEYRKFGPYLASDMGTSKMSIMETEAQIAEMTKKMEQEISGGREITKEHAGAEITPITKINVSSETEFNTPGKMLESKGGGAPSAKSSNKKKKKPAKGKDEDKDKLAKGKEEKGATASVETKDEEPKV